MTGDARSPTSAPQARLLVGATTNAFGNGLFLTIATLYFVSVRGFPAVTYGGALAAAAIAGFLAGPVLGTLSDRFGVRRSYVGLLAAQGLFSLLYVVTDSLAVVAAMVVAATMAERGAGAARGAYTAAVVPPEKRVRFRAALRAWSNASGGLGAAAGGLVLGFGTATAYNTAVLVNACTFFVAAALVASAPSVRMATPRTPRPRTFPMHAARDRPFLLLTAINAVLLIHVYMLTVGLPLWVAERTSAPVWIISILVLMSSIGVVLLQVPTSRFAHDLRASARAGLAAGALLALSCVVFSFTDMWLVPSAVIAMLIAGGLLHLGGELLQSSASWSFAFELAPADRHGEYQGVFNIGLDIAGLLGPPAFALLVASDSRAGWWILALVFLLAGATLPSAVRWASAGRGEEGPSG